MSPAEWQASEWWALPILIMLGVIAFAFAAWILCFAVLPGLSSMAREFFRMLRRP